jgi:hypothetical protein
MVNINKLDGNLYYKYTHPYNTSIDVELENGISYSTPPIVPEWKSYNRESKFGVSLKTMKHILDSFGNLIIFT